MNILIVDDEPLNLKLLRATLETAGYTVSKAVDGLEALELLESQGADAVISDILMPRMDGYRLCSEIRKRKQFEHLPFIHYTATYTSASDEKLSSDLGADVFLRKPAAADEILGALRRVTAKGRLAQAIPPIAEAEVMKAYSERLVSKLEHKCLELERTLENLTSERAQLHQLLAHSPAVIYTLEIDGEKVTPIVVSDNVERLLGFKVAESTRYEWWLEGLHPRDRDRVLGVLAKSLTGDGYSMEYRVRHKDGSYHWIEDNNRMIHGANGHATKAVGVWIDITERKRAEEAMEQSEHKYRHLFESLSEAAFLIDAKSRRILDTNLYAQKLLGRTRAEIIGMNEALLFPQNQAADYCEKVTSAGMDGKGELEGVEVQSKDGTIISVRVSLAPIELYGRDLLLALMADITERKRDEKQLREQADMLSRAHDAIIAHNFDDQRITFWNNGAERLYGWSADEAIGRSITELVHPDSKEGEDRLEALIPTGEFSGELKQITKDGREVIVDGRATIVRNPDGTPRSVLSINTDITGQKKLETQLLRAQRLESIGTLASGVAHDLNNILTPILVCSETLRTDLDEKDRQSTIDLIEESARRGASVVKQVLTFARGIEGQRVTVNPRHLIEEVVDIARKTFPKAIQISCRCPEDLWSIKGDPTQLHQVLLNLCVNARDAMPDGGSLIVSAENINVDEEYAAMAPGATVGPHVLFRVIDTGPGMSSVTIEKIFDPFFTTKQIGKGTGLGLSTALGIVKSHGGFLSVYSEIGKGTTFQVSLPAALSEEALQKSKVAQAPLQGNGELILIADDEPSIVRVTKMILEKNNYQVVSASDGPGALALFAQQMHSIPLVITDISMPYMNGVALSRALKKMKPGVSIIASTGQDDHQHDSELEALGVVDLLSKPYDSGKLLQALHDALAVAPK